MIQEQEMSLPLLFFPQRNAPEREHDDPFNSQIFHWDDISLCD